MRTAFHVSEQVCRLLSRHILPGLWNTDPDRIELILLAVLPIQVEMQIGKPEVGGILAMLGVDFAMLADGFDDFLRIGLVDANAIEGDDVS